MTYGSNSGSSDAVSRRIADLPPEKRALLEKLLRERQSQAQRALRIPRRPEGKLAPLSFSQQRVWFFEQLEPGTAVYNGPINYRIRGTLEPQALQRALIRLLQRHEPLRTAIVVEGSEPFQKAGLPEALKLEIEDLSALGAEDALAAAVQRAAAQRSEPFRLEGGLLLRARLLRLGLEDHVLLLTIHHLVFDGWSIGLLFRDLRELYLAEAAGRTPLLPELPISYGDFCAWQRGPDAQAEFRAQAEFWKAQLAGVTPLDLPLDVARPALQGFRGDMRRQQLSEALSTATRGLAQREGVTLFMLLLAAWGVLLSRLSGQRDVVIGTPVAGRRHEETENLIGFFVNTLGLRLDLTGNPTFVELLARVRQTCSAAFAHQDLPFEQVVAAHGGQRDPSRSPIFQVMLNLLNFSGETGTARPIPGFQWEAFAARDAEFSEQVDSKFELTLYGLERSSSIQLGLVYNRDLFHCDRIEEVLSQMVRLLEQVTACPSAGIDTLGLARPADLRAALPGPVDRPAVQQECLAHELFERAAVSHAERIAIEDAERRWSYRQVDEASGRIALWLRGNGVQAGDCVALHFERSAALALAVLGVLRSGAAFLILDPAYPDARLAAYWRVVTPRAFIQGTPLVHPAGSLAQLAAGVSRKLWVEPEGRLSTEVDGDVTALRGGITPDTLAYFAFTSGSSGQPKAVMGTHRPLGHFLRWHIAQHGFGPGDRFSMLSGLAHDPILRDILTPLSVGATLVVPPADETARASWGSWLRDRSITVCHLTPPLGRLMVQELMGSTAPASGAARLPALSHAFFGGDALLREDVRRLRSLAPDVKCVVFYGATETPQAMAHHQVQEAELADGQPERLPIGRGIEGVELWVVDVSGRPAGVGELGEILVRTPYLSSGYHGDLEATRQRFGTSGAAGDARFDQYRTGDLGRYRPDGSVEFVGRADQQVKVRGFRVELAEVTSVLSACAGVRQATVIARPDASGTARLVAYFVPATRPAPGGEELRAALAESLPDYMVPSTYVALEALPLTPNGKLDYRALPAPDLAVVAPTTPRAEPTGALELRIAEVWKEVLAVPQVGVDDNFFDLGGHSLLLVRLHQRLVQVLEVKPTLLDLFKYPTIRRLVRHLQPRTESSASPPVRSLAERANQRTRALDRQREMARRHRST